MSRGKSSCIGSSISDKKFKGILKDLSEDLVVIHRDTIRSSILSWLESVKSSLSSENDNSKYLKELERLKTQEKRLVDKYVDGMISEEIYDKKYSEIKASIAGVEKLMEPTGTNEDLEDIQNVIDNLDYELDEWIKTEDFERNKVEFLMEHIKKVDVTHNKHIIIYLDLVAGAIIAGKDFLLFVRECMPQPYGDVYFKKSC